MTAPTLAQVLDAVATTIGAAIGIIRVQSYDELTENIPETPCLQVWPGGGGTQDPSGNVDRSSFGAGVRQTIFVIYADLFSRPRTNIPDDMLAIVTHLDAVKSVLEAQDKKPYFGLPGVQGFQWTWTPIPAQDFESDVYAFARFAITIRTF